MSLRTMLTATALLAACGSGSAAEPPRSRLVQAAPAPQPVCTTIYKPVCGLDQNRRQRTYSNECLARAAGATNIYPGTCVADITND